MAIRLHIDPFDGGLQLLLKVRPPGGSPEIVMRSAVLEGRALAAATTFPSVPTRIYSVAAVSVDGTVDQGPLGRT